MAKTANFICRNASGSFFTIESDNAKDALKRAAQLFDAQGAYHLPITAEGDFGLDEWGYAEYTEFGKLMIENGKEVFKTYKQ